ncbi:hypothetical protein DIPPA_17482 [Diplonema papillatum]|nr:hypothetical protein DIPPA_17482 [Diplonema papillatum]
MNVLRTLLAAAAAAAAAVAVVNAEFSEPKPEAPVLTAARFVVCTVCPLERFGAVRKFIEEQEFWPAVQVEHSNTQLKPVLYWLNQHNGVLRKAYDFTGGETLEFVVGLLKEQNLVRGHVPTFVPETFPRSEHCFAWRAHVPAPHDDGTPGLERTYHLYPHDAECYERVKIPHPGYCECVDGTAVEVREDRDRPREPFSCEEKCRESGVKLVPVPGAEEPRFDEDEL